MSRYIDAEWLMNFFVDIPNNFTLTIGNLRATVNDAPSIDLVRCKECIWFDTDNTGEDYCMYVKGLADANANDFCSYGERSSE